MVALALASEVDATLTVLPEHIANPQPPMDWLPKPAKWEFLTPQKTASADPDPTEHDYAPERRSRRQRSHPNEPFYRGIKRRKRGW